MGGCSCWETVRDFFESTGDSLHMRQPKHFHGRLIVEGESEGGAGKRVGEGDRRMGEKMAVVFESLLISFWGYCRDRAGNIQNVLKGSRRH